LNVRKMVAIAALVLASGVTAGMARADEADQAIRVTFSGPVQIPRQVLPAGTYWFVVIDDRNPNMVQILSADRSKSYGILNTISRERSVEISNATFTLAKGRGATEPEAVVAWFYPGHTIGHEFVYTKPVGEELPKALQDTQVFGN
jgi:hypothetical protein